jgi:hypothetical protein
MRKWFAVALLFGCAMTSLANAAPSGADAPFAGRDASVRPGDDFFAYANGGWLPTTEIPADHSDYGTFTRLQKLVDKRIRDLVLTAARSGSSADGSARRVGDFFKSFMDEAAIEKKGLAPLKPWLDRIDSINSRTDLSRALGRTLRADVDVLNATSVYTPNVLGLWVAQDLVPRQDPRAGVASDDHRQWSRAASVPRRYRAQPRSLVRGFRCGGRPGALPGAERARPHLVGERPKQIAALEWRLRPARIWTEGFK